MKSIILCLCLLVLTACTIHSQRDARALTPKLASRYHAIVIANQHEIKFDVSVRSNVATFHNQSGITLAQFLAVNCPALGKVTAKNPDQAFLQYYDSDIALFAYGFSKATFFAREFTLHPFEKKDKDQVILKTISPYNPNHPKTCDVVIKLTSDSAK
ncbi:MAG: hypothetical protein AAGA27_06105 [Pseudomonadota bacterium]